MVKIAYKVQLKRELLTPEDRLKTHPIVRCVAP